MKILTIISNYNEESEILNTIQDVIENSSIESDILVIDNASNDNSLKLIKSTPVDYISHPVNSGGSVGVIKTSFLYAYMSEYDVYCHMDGDNQHNASDLYKLLEPLKDNQADIVIGSRFINKEGFQSLFFRRIGIRTFSTIVSKLTGNQITDLTSGFRAYNRKAIEFFAKGHRHEFEACIQMLLIASFAGLRIKEVPVIMKPRNSGKSEINFIKSLQFPIFGIISIIGTLLQKSLIKLKKENK